jgi:hypothetical protein
MISFLVDPSQYKKKATVVQISIAAEILGTILGVFEILLRDKKKGSQPKVSHQVALFAVPYFN